MTKNQTKPVVVPDYVKFLFGGLSGYVIATHTSTAPPLFIRFLF